MNLAEFYRLHDRVARSKSTVYTMAHVGYDQSHTLPDGSDGVTKIRGIKSPEQLEDELLNLFIWIWSMKDYLKELCRNRSVDPQGIERIVNTVDALMIAADIANRAKHGELRNSRTGDFARLENVGYTIDRSAVESIAFRPREVELTVAIPDDAELRGSVEFDSGKTGRDAFEVAEEAIIAWETRAFGLAGA
ncbi:hypothetical protein SH528x_002419 [Novipirellula sp. SH528]|uniref:hypothetical protein n=1 Tax=Novipirellula sp. SH528 TaxID=3454466 RepID=UPI003F9F0742